MAKRRMLFTVLCAAVVLFPVAVSAQGLESTDAEFRVFAVELGSLAGYNLQDEEAVIGRNFGLSLAVMENIQVGLGAVMFSADGIPQRMFAGMKFDYFFTDRLAFSLLTGNASVGGTPGFGGGLGGQYLIVRSQPENGFSSALKVKVDYFMNDEDGPDAGTVAIGLAGSIGL